MGVRGVGKGREPSTGPRVAVEDEVVTGHEIAESAGLDHGGQRLLGGGERLVRDVSARWDARPELELSVSVEGKPDACRESGRGRQADHLGFLRRCPG